MVKKRTASLIDNLSETDIESLYQIVELMILAGISTRNISGHDYVARAMAGRLFVKDAFDTCKTLLDFQAIDFYRMRNKFAHGERDDQTTIWNAQEHLVLSSHIFPLLVKLYLTKQRLFAMRPLQDNRGLFQFDFFLLRNDLLVEDVSWSKAKMDAVLTGSGLFRTY